MAIQKTKVHRKIHTGDVISIPTKLDLSRTLLKSTWSWNFGNYTNSVIWTVGDSIWKMSKYSFTIWQQMACINWPISKAAAQMFFKIAVLKYFAIFTRKHLFCSLNNWSGCFCYFWDLFENLRKEKNCLRSVHCWIKVHSN